MTIQIDIDAISARIAQLEAEGDASPADSQDAKCLEAHAAEAVLRLPVNQPAGDPVPTDPRPSAAQQLPEPFFHRESGAVRFWVRTVEGDTVGAMARKEAMHFRFRAAADGSDALRTYRNHRHKIDGAVLRRIAAGSLEPVILREADFDLPFAAMPP